MTTIAAPTSFDLIKESIIRRLKDPHFDKSVHRFILPLIVTSDMTVRHQHNRRHKWRKRLRKMDFRRRALNQLFGFLIHNVKDIGWLGPEPDATDDLANATLAIFEKLETDKLKWLPPELVCMLWPRTTAHMICESLGYAGATRAARIVWDGHLGVSNFCEWIDACYRNDARKALSAATKSPEWSPRKRRHSGYMSSYRQAMVCVAKEILGKEPDHFGLAAWF
jgi:hypothetical protein